LRFSGPRQWSATRHDFRLLCLFYAEGVKVLLDVLLASVLARSAWAQAPSSRLPRFEDYGINDIFKGTPAAPLIETPLDRMYRTRIRQGVTKGWGTFRDGKEQAGPNFAGHYFVIQWGCGTSCLMMVVVDALTGKIHHLPLAFGREGNQKIGLPMFGLRPAEVDFRVTSRLFTMNACPEHPNRAHASCFSYYYLWQDNEWRLLRRVRLEDDSF